MRIYIATPINARKEKTFEEKRKAAAERAEYLKSQLQKDYPKAHIVTPFDIIPLTEQVTEPEALGRCVKTVLQSDILYLDKGWRHSQGCRLEHHTAKVYHKSIFYGTR